MFRGTEGCQRLLSAVKCPPRLPLSGEEQQIHEMVSGPCQNSLEFARTFQNHQLMAALFLGVPRGYPVLPGEKSEHICASWQRGQI